MGGGILLSEELSSSLTRLNFLPGWSTAVWRTLPSSLPRSHWRLAGTYCTALLLPASVSPQPSNYFQLCFLFWGCKLQQSFFSWSMALATYVWAQTLNNLVLLNLWYYRFNFHQHILIWKQMKEERPNKQQIEDTSTLFIKSWVSQYFVIDKTTVLCSRSFTEQKDHSVWASVWAKRCLFLDLFKSFPRNERIERTQKFVKMMTFLVYIVQRRSSPKAFFTGWSGVFSLWFYTLCINWYYPNLPIDCAHLFVYFCGVKPKILSVLKGQLLSIPRSFSQGNA